MLSFTPLYLSSDSPLDWILFYLEVPKFPEATAYDSGCEFRGE